MTKHTKKSEKTLKQGILPKLFFCKQLSLVVNKQALRTMKTAIDIFWPLVFLQLKV
jgi:hypothetical protein